MVSLVELYRPRMTTEGGNLVFLTSLAQNIEFRTGSLGKVKLNNEDLGECLHQVMHWKNTDVALYIHPIKLSCPAQY